MKKLITIALTLLSISACAETRPQEVLDYWFGSLKTADDYPEQKSKIWFGGGVEIDNEIRDKFELLVIAAAQGELNAWTESPQGRLALILLLDQFPRNIYRNAPQAFAFDTLAQKLTLEGLPDAEALLPIQRVFLYMPLEHAENVDLQILSVAAFNALIPLVPSAQKATFVSFADYAQRHYAIIARFGRFPHRNAILDRPSTPEEIEFLKGPHSSF